MPLRAGKKVLTGVLAWAAIAAAIAVAVERIEPATRARLDHVRGEAWRTLRERPPEFRVRFAGAALQGGAKLVERSNGVLARVDGRIERVGEVTRIRVEGDDVVVTIALDRERATFPIRQGARAVRRSQGRSFVVAVQALLTEDRRAEVARRWQEFRDLHQAAVLAELGRSSGADAGRRAIVEQLPRRSAATAPGRRAADAAQAGSARPAAAPRQDLADRRAPREA
jgi:hypothetical protein